MTKRNNLISALVVIFILIVMVAAAAIAYEMFKPRFGNHGSVSEFEGNTVVISLFVSDKNGTWGDNKKKDDALQKDMLNYLGIATDWLSSNAADYGVKSKFIYDWTKDSDLMLHTKMKTNLVTSKSGDEKVWRYIDDNIYYKSLQDKYDADNVLFMVFLDTPSSLEETSCTRYYYDGMPYPYEICYIYSHCDGDKESPATIAHEILHAFGAPDLYSEDKDGDNYGITKKYVNHLDKINSNDIMYRTYDENYNMVYDKITNDFTEIDAYYVGLTNKSKVVDKWGFDESEHAND